MKDKSQLYKYGYFKAQVDSVVILLVSFSLSALGTMTYRNVWIWIGASVGTAIVLASVYSIGISFGKRWGKFKNLTGKTYK